LNTPKNKKEKARTTKSAYCIARFGGATSADSRIAVPSYRTGTLSENLSTKCVTLFNRNSFFSIFTLFQYKKIEIKYIFIEYQ
jgi:hypothetical protein